MAYNEDTLPTGFPSSPAVHDAWFRAKVQEALDDLRPAIAEQAVEAHFAERRANAQRKASEDGEPLSDQ